MSNALRRGPFLAAAGAFAVGLRCRPSSAEGPNHVRVAKSIPGVFPYVPIDVGIDRQLYQNHGLQLDVLTFTGSAKMHAALIAGELDIALGSGSTMINRLKGEPSLCVAETLGPPLELGVVVPYDSPITSLDDFKGKVVGVSTVGSPLEWMVFELSRVKGWGPRGIRTVAIGTNAAGIATLRTHDVDAIITDVGLVYQLEPQKVIRLIAPCSDYVHSFIMHTIYASNAFAQSQPAVLRSFLQGWFETVAFMRANKDATDTIAAAADGIDAGPQAKLYDLLTPHFSLDGRFDREGLATLARSYVELGLLDQVPDMSQLYTEAFLPKPAHR
jgi:ABC-type nitrate/sulfonate/bicarbonate transport system substrate-binding protein